MRYASKKALIADIEREHQALCTLLREIPASRLREPGVWGDGWTVTDLVAHLAAWHRLFLSWYEEGLHDGTPVMPAAGFTWRELPRLNRDIQVRHRRRTFAAVRTEFNSGYRRIVSLVRGLPPRNLLAAGHFAWTGKYPLSTYLGPNTASHYRFARKVLRRWLRNGPRSADSRPDQGRSPR